MGTNEWVNKVVDFRRCSQVPSKFYLPCSHTSIPNNGLRPVVASKGSWLNLVAHSILPTKRKKYSIHEINTRIPNISFRIPRHPRKKNVPVFGLNPNHPHPEPCTATVIPLNSFFIESTSPKVSSIAVFNSPSFKTELSFAHKFSQKRVWFKCPPPLNLSAPSKPMIPDTSPALTAASSFSSATLRFVTYVLWCLEWWSVMVSADTTAIYLM